MPTHQERQLRRIEDALNIHTGDTVYRDRVTVDWLRTLSDDDFELVGEVVEHQHATGELPDPSAERAARFRVLDQEVRQYLRDHGIRDG